MMKLLTLCAVTEAATGVAVLAVPSVVVRLLFGAELAGVSVPVARMLGIALIALGIACWPGRTALCGLLTYNVLATLYLVYVAGGFAGKLLWPAVGWHAVLSILLGRAWFINSKTGGRNNHGSGKG